MSKMETEIYSDTFPFSKTEYPFFVRFVNIKHKRVEDVTPLFFVISAGKY